MSLNSTIEWTPAAVKFLSIEPLLEDLGTLDLRGIHWVIVGGESGRGARPMSREWVISIRDQCAKAGVPFFFTQWGGVHQKKPEGCWAEQPITSFRRGSRTQSPLPMSVSGGLLR